MPKHGKNFLNASKKVPAGTLFSTEDAIQLVKQLAFAKFDETVEVGARLGVNPKHADQIVRGTVVLPHGIGKTVRVVVFAEGEKAAEAQQAGAEFVGSDDLIAKIQGGWLDFEACVALPNMMGKVGRLGRVLGPRGLMPNPKSGTVTFDVAQTIREIKAGRVEFRVDKTSNVHAPVGKVSFSPEKLLENVNQFLETLVKAKPAAAKGRYLRSVVLCSTMGPGIALDALEIANRYRS
ncbi:MAG: 50S ribosomal protein L1 [Candidatus Schekmanbacteria bacterium]|nr:50S ribosomal protein L1 [Candidatus Schekmanbacteria bacterium]